MHKDYIKFIGVFLATFCLCYFGTQAVIGLASPYGDHYNNFIDQHLNYIKWLRSLLTYSSKFLLGIFGYTVDIVNPTYIKIRGGHGVNIVYSCLGYGIISFWIAFIVANKGDFTKKISWFCIGFFSICIINIFRISLLLLSNNKNWTGFFQINHHTIFNIVAYLFIFLLIWFYDKSTKKV